MRRLLVFIVATVTSGYNAEDRVHAYPKLVAGRLWAAGYKTIHV